MTLADFINVFDFEQFNMNIAYYGDSDTYTYNSKADIERDYCTIIYTVIEIRPADDSTIQVVIWN